MVKPGGTGRPRLVISARFAPLPPRRSLRSLLPSVKSYTNFGTEYSSHLAPRTRRAPLYGLYSGRSGGNDHTQRYRSGQWIQYRAEKYRVSSALGRLTSGLDPLRKLV